MKRYLRAAAALAVGLAACKKAEPASLYEKIPVARRDIVVSASASGAIKPVLTVDVKSKASGEIIEMKVETGDDVRPGQLLAKIDPRQPRNTLALAEANLEVAKAQLANARAQLNRADTLFKAQAITETEYETAKLAYANANAQLVNAQTNLETARDAMEDTQVRAPLGGTVIQKNVELGTVISSPTRDVGGGTVLFRMANLDTVQVEALVDETDIGKVQPGLPVTITVDAYPSHPFSGAVLKIEPQATVQQNVTMFPVLANIANPGHLLKPGMNSEVEIHIGQRQGVLAIPNAALRTPRDVGSAAHVLGLDPAAVQQQLAAAPAPVRPSGDTGSASLGGGPARGNTFTTRDGRTITLPPGVTAEQVRAAFQKMFSGAELSPAEQAMLRQVRAQFQAAGGMGGRGGGGSGGSGGSGGGGMGRPGAPARNGEFDVSYIVFALRDGKPVPVRIRTGLTDLDYIEVVNGLTEQDTVLVLPSASLVQAQQEFRERFQRMTGGGLPGLRQQPTGGQRPTTPR